MIDDLVRDGLEALKELEGRTLSQEVSQAAELLATVIGQDIEQTGHGVFRIARRTAPDRVISTVDPQARHRHKTAARGFDGYKGHVAIDPDSEIITATTVTPGNTGDAAAAPVLIADLLPEAPAAQNRLSQLPCRISPPPPTTTRPSASSRATRPVTPSPNGDPEPTAPPVPRLRDLLAQTLHDPSVELAYWLPEKHSFVDVQGRPIKPPIALR
jgi:hypothetical protein